MTEPASSPSDAQGKRSKKLIIIGSVVAVIVVVAIAVGCVVANMPKVAATVNGQNMLEERVTEWVQSYRQNYGLTDDADWKECLETSGVNVEDFRKQVINQLATEDLVRARAEELGITVSDDEVEAYLDEMKGDKDTGEGSLWASVLESAGLTEDILRDRYRYNLTQQKVLAAEVPEREATDDELVEYAQDYLAGTTQMHIMHIVISGDDAQSRATELYQQLNAEREAGTLDAERFSEYAKQYSSESDVATTGGAVGWTGSGTVSDGVKEILSSDEDGSIGLGSVLSPVQYAEVDGAYEVAYVDQIFTVPQASEITSLESLNAPQGVVDALKAAAVYVAYQNDCADYLASLLNSATIVYNDMPKDVPYNVS